MARAETRLSPHDPGGATQFFTTGKAAVGMKRPIGIQVASEPTKSPTLQSSPQSSQTRSRCTTGVSAQYVGNVSGRIQHLLPWPHTDQVCVWNSKQCIM